MNTETNTDDKKREHADISIAAIIISSFTAIICAFILFVIFKSKSFQTYSFYYVIIFNVVFILDNFLRIFPFDDGKDYSFTPKEIIQAINLVFLNKFEICVITMQNLTLYLGVTKADKYLTYQRLIFFISLFLSIFISFIVTILILYLSESFKPFSVYCYINLTDETIIIDSIFHGIFYLATLFFLFNLLFYLGKKRREVKLGNIEDMDYGRHQCKYTILHILIVAFFAVSFLSNVLEDLNSDQKKIFDFLFLIIGFIIDLAYCVNRVLVKETLKIFCKDSYKSKYEALQKLKLLGKDENYEDNDEDEDEEAKRQRTGSF